jgi:hypothetical protein
MAEKTTAKSKGTTKTVVCALCDKAITDGKPVIIDDDPYHSDCAKAMSQSTSAEAEDDEDDAEDADDEDDADEADDDDEEEEEPAPRRKPAKATKPAAKPVAKKRAVVEDDDEDDEDDEDDDDEEEEEEPAPRRASKPVAKAKAAPAKRRAPVDEDEDEDDDEDDEEEEEEEAPVRSKKAAPAKASAKPAAKTSRRAADYEEEEEAEEKPAKKAAARNGTSTATRKKSTVDESGWGNPATTGSKRYFVYNALKEVTKADLREADGPGKPENVIKRAKRLHRDYAKVQRVTLSEKDQDYSSMNVNWISNHADDLGLVMAHNEEAGTYRVIRANPKEEE